jgi:arginine repressor
MPDAGAKYVPVGRLLQSRSPVTELGAAAMQAQDAAGLDRADFIVIAVEPGTADALAPLLERTARDADVPA